MRFRAAGRSAALIHRLLFLGLAALAGAPGVARAQVEAPPPPQPSSVTSRLGRTSEERDRFEVGAARPDGYFNVLGTFAYRRFIHESSAFDQSLQGEVTGTKRGYLSEGTLSVYYFFRPLISYRTEWRLRPLLEAGPGAHLSIQIADIQGFSETSFRTRSYLKTHAYVGFEYLISRRFGFLVRGRMSVPAHRPVDYAQAAIFLR